ncbi:MAG: universal stress protein [Pseudomonadota bacterium]|uniref:universal stress protein n=1 Tax=Alcanivorax sp. TaxID=1872427 RepID=UPI0025BA62E8|nr:universal stress protein [Alcanivorax sp.]MED5239212.1 universal stress protein [Pseudomonadota bacterium]MEE3321863.1 universal stress protein [Pseudomonadota bacterium]
MTNVIACIDGSAATASICDYAAWSAQRLDAPLTLLHVLDHSRYPVAADFSGNLSMGGREHLMQELADLDAQRNRVALEQGKLMLEAARERVVADGIASPKERQRHGDLVDTLTGLEDEMRLLVIGKQGEEHGGIGAQLGDNVERVIRAVHRPILVAVGQFKAPQTIMLAYDDSETTRKGVSMLSDSPLFKGLDCHLVTVGKSRDLQWAADKLSGAGHQVTTAQLEGEVEPALHDYQQNHAVDLVVMGAYGHSRIREFFVGSTTNKMIREARVPHLLLR